jgi:hypothetical protein
MAVLRDRAKRAWGAVAEARSHIIGGVVAGLVLLAVPAIARLGIGASLGVPYWAWIAAAAAVAAMVAIRAAIRWFSHLSSSVSQLAADTKVLKNRNEALWDTLTLDDALRLAERRGWTVEIEEDFDRLTYKVSRRRPVAIRNAGPLAMKQAASVVIDGEERNLPRDTIDRILVSGIATVATTQAWDLDH